MRPHRASTSPLTGKEARLFGKGRNDESCDEEKPRQAAGPGRGTAGPGVCVPRRRWHSEGGGKPLEGVFFKTIELPSHQSMGER